MIFYFSGTGNSRYAAQCIAKITGDHIVSIGKYIKEGSKEGFRSEQPLVFVCPVYAWKIPRLVEDFIRNTSFSGNRNVYFILTCGDSPGNAIAGVKSLCGKKEFTFMGLASVIMPENYIALFRTPDKASARVLVEQATPGLLDLAETIRANQPLTDSRVSAAGALFNSAVNRAFYALIVSARGFRVSDACTGCGKCAELCALNNIHLTGGRPQWGDRCTHCMACICGCPFEAIDYKNKTKRRHRVYLTDEPL
jgi:ferredoxin